MLQELRLSVSIWTILLVLFLPGCGQQVYTDEESLIQERFRAVETGTGEQQLTESLGAPAGIVMRDAQSQLSFQRREDGTSKQYVLNENDRSEWPHDLQFLPKRPVAWKVFVYTEATVFAYFFVGADGRVEHVSVHTS